MLIFISGKPGSSKTLHTIAEVEAMRREALKTRGVERGVYYWNIGDVTLSGWHALGDAGTFDRAHDGVEPDMSQALKWFECPRDSIIVLDECQKIFPKRPQGSVVPKHVEHLQTHRKGGFDLVLVTQDPTLVDTDVRKIVGRHTHYRRIFGTETYHSFTWMEKAVRDPESRSEQAGSLEKRGRFPKQYYGTYRSANVHNVQARHPWKWYAAIGAAVVLVPLLGWSSIAYLKRHTAQSPAPLTAQELDAKLARSQADTVSQVVLHVKSLLESNPWDQRLHRARVGGVDASMPFYDELVRPVSFPKVRGCAQVVIDGEVDCRCTSQQGTLLDMSPSQCMRALKRGVFDFAKPDERDSGEGRDALTASDGPPDVTAGVSAPSRGPEVATASRGGEGASRAAGD